MWTIFKVFIEFVTIFLLFYVSVLWPWGTWDLSSLTRDRTHTSCIGRWRLNHWTAREVPKIIFKICCGKLDVVSWATKQIQSKHHPDARPVRMVAPKAGLRGAWVLLVFKYLRISKTSSLTNQFCRKHSGMHRDYIAFLNRQAYFLGSSNSQKGRRILTFAPQTTPSENGRTLHRVRN